MIEVARTYRFQARHHVAAAPPPWNEEHSHVYTVEVVVAGDVDRETGMILDTDRLDGAWRQIAPTDDANLNVLTQTTTTVEALAAMWLSDLRARVPEIVSVRVQEDDERWGRAS